MSDGQARLGSVGVDGSVAGVSAGRADPMTPEELPARMRAAFDPAGELVAPPEPLSREWLRQRGLVDRRRSRR